MKHDDGAEFLEAAKKRKIAYCKKYGLPIPAFDKAEDFYVDPRIPCPKCGSYNGYTAKGTFTQHYDATGSPNGYEFDGTESLTVKCVNCNASFPRERLWKKG